MVNMGVIVTSPPVSTIPVLVNFIVSIDKKVILLTMNSNLLTGADPANPVVREVLIDEKREEVAHPQPTVVKPPQKKQKAKPKEGKKGKKSSKKQTSKPSQKPLVSGSVPVLPESLRKQPASHKLSDAVLKRNPSPLSSLEEGEDHHTVVRLKPHRKQNQLPKITQYAPYGY